MVAFGISKTVHGDIRHLEILTIVVDCEILVHGDIRHLETENVWKYLSVKVHGDIRHLEIMVA